VFTCAYGLIYNDIFGREKMEDPIEEEGEWLRDEITGLKRKSNTTILNKKKLSKYELDELFTAE
jgi:hypothetical protein